MYSLYSWIIVGPSEGFTGVTLFFGGILTEYYFENLDLETILLFDLPPDVNLKFRPL
jgi:hypothetical protein